MSKTTQMPSLYLGSELTLGGQTAGSGMLYGSLDDRRENWAQTQTCKTRLASDGQELKTSGKGTRAQNRVGTAQAVLVAGKGAEPGRWPPHEEAGKPSTFMWKKYTEGLRAHTARAV